MLQKLANRNSKGFTLIELMIVIAIIGILAAIAIPNFLRYRDKAYCAKAETDAQNIIAALSSYFADPDHTAIPLMQELTSLEELILNNPTEAALRRDGNGAIITVGDDANRCPYFVKEGERYWAYFGTDTGNDPGWGP
jgi:prepilin-type N-terminal cleavage/methylation domain-containing protein